MHNNLLFSKKSGIDYTIPFILLTFCFALWGFANDITNPMVKAFSKIFKMSVTDGTLVQVAFYGGYFCMAIPAALFIRKYSYKSGIVLGLTLYAVGALLFIPASRIGIYYYFLFAYFILTCGLSFLETSANPYILSMGDKETATRRLNLAQSFNPIGSLAGMFVAMQFIQARLCPLSSSERKTLPDDVFESIKFHDLEILSKPYATIGTVIVILLVIMIVYKMPKGENVSSNHTINFIPTLKRLLSIKSYREGVIAQFFYVGAQIMCWTFIIQYGTRIFMLENMPEQDAEILSQKYNIVAMVLFCLSRFICTYLMKKINPSKLLTIFSLIAILLLSGVILIDGKIGLYMLVGVSVCMSLMFPTIYGISLNDMDNEDAKIGAAGLIMSILGGSLLPAVQAYIIDIDMTTMPSVNISFIIPLFSFIVIAIYGFRITKKIIA